MSSPRHVAAWGVVTRAGHVTTEGPDQQTRVSVSGGGGGPEHVCCLQEVGKAGSVSGG